MQAQLKLRSRSNTHKSSVEVRELSTQPLEDPHAVQLLAQREGLRVSGRGLSELWPKLESDQGDPVGDRTSLDGRGYAAVTHSPQSLVALTQYKCIWGHEKPKAVCAVIFPLVAIPTGTCSLWHLQGRGRWSWRLTTVDRIMILQRCPLPGPQNLRRHLMWQKGFC